MKIDFYIFPVSFRGHFGWCNSLVHFGVLQQMLFGNAFSPRECFSFKIVKSLEIVHKVVFYYLWLILSL